MTIKLKLMTVVLCKSGDIETKPLTSHVNKNNTNSQLSLIQSLSITQVNVPECLCHDHAVDDGSRIPTWFWI